MKAFVECPVKKTLSLTADCYNCKHVDAGHLRTGLLKCVEKKSNVFSVIHMPPTFSNDKVR